MIILEGADGTGKTTLANALAKRMNGMVLHAGWDKNWSIRQFHVAVLTSAYFIENTGCPVILDRWALSEAVYGRVFRDGEAYDTAALMQDAIENYKPILIYCSNPEAVENHRKNRQIRDEMFDDVSHVVTTYEDLLSSGKYGEWYDYDFTTTNMDRFVEQIIDEYTN